jgi:hypothetical protein
MTSMQKADTAKSQVPTEKYCHRTIIKMSGITIRKAQIPEHENRTISSNKSSKNNLFFFKLWSMPLFLLFNTQFRKKSALVFNPNFQSSTQVPEIASWDELI